MISVLIIIIIIIYTIVIHIYSLEIHVTPNVLFGDNRFKIKNKNL